MLYLLNILPVVFLLCQSLRLHFYLTHINYVLMFLSTIFKSDILNCLVRSTNISSSLIWVMVFPFWNEKYKNQMNINKVHYIFSILCCILHKKTEMNIQESLLISLMFQLTYNIVFFNHYYPEIHNHHILKWFIIPLCIAIEVIV